MGNLFTHHQTCPNATINKNRIFTLTSNFVKTYCTTSQDAVCDNPKFLIAIYLSYLDQHMEPDEFDKYEATMQPHEHLNMMLRCAQEYAVWYSRRPHFVMYSVVSAETFPDVLGIQGLALSRMPTYDYKYRYEGCNHNNYGCGSIGHE